MAECLLFQNRFRLDVLIVFAESYGRELTNNRDRAHRYFNRWALFVILIFFSNVLEA